jgi:hypothetical protein
MRRPEAYTANSAFANTIRRRCRCLDCGQVRIDKVYAWSSCGLRADYFRLRRRRSAKSPPKASSENVAGSGIGVRRKARS